MIKCDVCKYSVTPKGKQCYTLTRILKALPSWKLIPEYVIPIMENGCKRFRPRLVGVEDNPSGRGEPI